MWRQNESSFELEGKSTTGQMRLLETFCKLSDIEQYCVFLRIQGLKYREISIVLERSPRAVTSTVARALRQMGWNSSAANEKFASLWSRSVQQALYELVSASNIDPLRDTSGWKIVKVAFDDNQEVNRNGRKSRSQ
jgi:hypothetical protein